MREGTQDQMRRLFGLEPKDGSGAVQAGAGLERRRNASAASHASEPSHHVRVPKTMFGDMRVYGSLSKYPVSFDTAFIQDKSPVDVLLEKQVRVLASDDIHIELLHPQHSFLSMVTHVTKNTFVIKAKPFVRGEERVSVRTPEQERELLEEVELLYRRMPGAHTSWAHESVYIGSNVRTSAALVITLDKSEQAKRAREVLELVMKDKSPQIS